MAMIIATLRLIFDGERKATKIVIESLLCGALSLCAAGVIDIISIFFDKDIPMRFIISISGAIGFFGVETIRNFTNNYLNKRINN